MGTEDVGLIGDAELLQLGAGPLDHRPVRIRAHNDSDFLHKKLSFQDPGRGTGEKERPGPLSPGKRFRPPAWNGQPGIAYLLFLGAQIPPQDAVLPTDGRQAHKHRRTSLPNNEWTFILSKNPDICKGAGHFCQLPQGAGEKMTGKSSGRRGRAHSRPAVTRMRLTSSARRDQAAAAP